MECMEKIREALLEEVCGHLDELDKVNVEELGIVIKAIKGLSEAIYYDTIVKSMEAKTGTTTSQE